MAGSGTMSVDSGRNGKFNTERRAEKDSSKAERLDRGRNPKRSRPEKAPPKNPPKGRGRE